MVIAAGCSSGPRRNLAHVPDWVSEDTASAPVGPWPVPSPEPAPALAPPAVVAPGNQFTETWIPLERWCKVNGLPAPSRLALAPLPSYAINTTSGVLTLSACSRSAHWDGLELRLGFAPQSIDGQPFVHALDLKKTIQPLLAEEQFMPPDTTLQSRRQTGPGPILVIDPGHGGEDAGAKSVLANRYEKEFALDWARRVKSLLATNGWQVFLTRATDVDLSLSNRVAFAEERKASLFLSLHFNSAPANASEAGLETYCLTPAGMLSSVTRGFGDDPALVFPNNAFDAQNLQFAFRIHRALLQVNGHRDRGVRRARFLGVLRGQQRPAILVEGGYLSNPREAQLISEAGYRQKLAEAVARALE